MIPGPGAGKDRYEPGASGPTEKCSELNGWASETWGLLLATEDTPRGSKIIMMSCSVLDGILEPENRH